MGEDLFDQLRLAGALKEGHFLLASGRHSGQYVEKFDLLRQPNQASRFVTGMAENARSSGAELIAGPTTGGIILAFEVGRQLGLPAAYAERKSDGASGREFRRGTTIAAGTRTYVVDDILTTGGSIRETLAALADWGADVVGVGVLVDRSGGKVDFGLPLHPLVQLNIGTWSEVDCPLCAAGIPLVKPGTTKLS